MTDTTRQTPGGGLSDLGELVERLRNTVAGLLPTELASRAGEPLEAAIRQVLSSADLVPRQELEAHLRVLSRLEERVSDLERQLARQTVSPGNNNEP